MTTHEHNAERAHPHRVCVFSPGPVVTVTIEHSETNGEAEIHFHAGGQGFWVARMAHLLGTSPQLCVPLGGEAGPILRLLMEREGVEVHPIDMEGSNGVYVHDRREGDRVVIAETPVGGLTRHEVDDLYNVAVAQAISAGVLVLTGSGKGARAVPDTLYGRLSTDVRANGVTTVADLAGGPLRRLEQVDVLKVSHEELVQDNLARSGEVADLCPAMESLADELGARAIIVSRAADPAIVLIEGELAELVPPRFEAVDHRGAGDSMTAAVASGLAMGLDMRESLRLGAAAGALNVTRHGLGSGQRESVEQLATEVEIRTLGKR